MTPDELREIDARIAVAFFGWRWVKMPHNGVIQIRPPEREFEQDELCNPPDVIKDHHVDRLPRYSTDPAAATMLWDKLREMGLRVMLESDVRFAAHLANSESWVGSSGQQETWPLALCKAALAMAEATGAKGATTNG